MNSFLIVGLFIFCLLGICSFQYWWVVLTLGALSVIFIRNTSIKLALASVLFSLITVDLTLRIFYPNLLAYRPSDIFFESSTDYRGLFRFQKNINYTMPTHGDLAALGARDFLFLKESREETLITDEFGFPNPSNQSKPVNLLILGDSVSAGIGVSFNQSWAHHLSKQYSIYNMSIPSSPGTQVTNLAIEIPRLKFDSKCVLLWVLFGGNDLTENYIALTYDLNKVGTDEFKKHEIAAINFQRKSPVNALLNSLLYIFIPTSKVFSYNITPYGDVLFTKPYQEVALMNSTEITSHENWPRFIESLKRGKAIADSYKLDLRLVFIPSKEEVYLPINKKPSAFSELAGEEASKLEIKYYNLSPVLIDEAKKALENKQLLWWRDDTHLNIIGNEKVSQIMKEKVLLD
jgi:lysophospholipase L1-like esterase